MEFLVKAKPGIAKKECKGFKKSNGTEDTKLKAVFSFIVHARLRC